MSESDRYKHIFEQSRDALMMLKAPHWFFSSCNQATLDLFEIPSEEEFCKLGPWNVSPELQPCNQQSSELAARHIQDALEKGSHFFHWDHMTSQQRVIPCTVLLSKIIENGETYLLANVRNIEQQVQLEKELKHSQRRLDLALEGANLGVWDWDLITNKVYFDERWANMRGVSQSNLAMDISDWESRVHPEDLETAYLDINKYLNGQSQYYENIHRVKHANGCWVHILGRGRFSEWDSNGKPIRFTGTDFDVTDIIHGKTKMDLLFSNSPTGLFLCDEKGYILEVNPAMCALLGRTKSDIEKSNIRSYLTKESIDVNIESFQKLSTDGHVKNSIFEIVNSHHETRTVRINVFLIKDYDRLNGYWCTVEDVTQEMERTQLLKVSSKLRQAYIHSVQSRKQFFVGFLADLITKTSASYGVMFGVSGNQTTVFCTSEIFDRSQPTQLHDIIDLLRENNIDQGKTYFAENINSKKFPYRKFLVMSLPFKDGGHYYCVLEGSRQASLAEQDYLKYEPLFSLFMDLFTSYKYEMDLNREKQVSLHREKLASLGELAAGVGHEINNPLAVIKGNLEYLQREIQKTANQTGHDCVQERVDKMFYAIKRISNIVSGMRSISRNDLVELAVLNYSDLTLRLVASMQDLPNCRNIELIHNIAENVFVRGNETHLEQIVINLISNAIDAVKNQDKKTVEIELVTHENLASLFVHDSGAGIVDEVAKKIFDPFFTTKKVNEGTGIGLSLVSTMVKEHSGEISFYDSPLGGCCFQIDIPLVSSITLQPRNNSCSIESDEAFHHSPSCGDLTVLLVDDEKDLIEVMEDYLDYLDVTVLVSNCGKEALKILKQHSGEIDCIISDIKMSDGDGLYLLEEARELNYDNDFYFITGGVNMALESVAEKVSGIIKKPFSSDDFERVIKKIRIRKYDGRKQSA